jgi:hypothetical protein
MGYLLYANSPKSRLSGITLFLGTPYVASKTIPVWMYELHLHHAPGSFVQVVASDGIINSVYGQLPLMKSCFEAWLLAVVSLDWLRPYQLFLFI